MLSDRLFMLYNEVHIKIVTKVQLTTLQNIAAKPVQMGTL